MFLDEPTSGLSSRDSENILDLLKELARKGKLLFIVIHQPSSEIFKMFDKLIILDTGGYLIYNGNPIDSIEYFKRKIEQANYNESECYVCGNVNPEQIFNIVETKVFTESGQPTETRRISPADWSNLYKEEKKEDKREPGSALPEINFKTPNRFRQLIVFTKRDVLSKVADTQYIITTLLLAPVIAFVLAFLIRYFDESVKDSHYTLYDNSNLPFYVFMAVIISIFMGLTPSADEIIKDRKILKREAFLNLSWNSYLMSKVLVQFAISAIQALTFVLVGNGILGIRGMMFEYWLVLFSCWIGANMVGLIISDSFKAVVTIYMIIPFLLIPNMITSGGMIKFEKLNPNISSPVAIPFYGELFPTRWGYEALTVKQFIDNKYESQFYIYDKAMSKAKYKKDYWNVEMKGKLDNILSELNKGTRSDEFNDKLLLVYNEIRKEQVSTPDVKFNYTESMKPDKVTTDAVNAALKYIDAIRKYYILYYNNAKDRKDAIITRLQTEDSKKFLKLRDNYDNKSLGEFVTYKDETVKTMDYKGEIVQKLEPIYMDPKYPFIKAHFYSPTKQVFGSKVDTFIINVIVLWVMTIVLYLALYFRVLKKLLDSGEVVMGKKPKGTE
jgi:energy-coupling factor transporter ATP-binding protein EcfA2